MATSSISSLGLGSGLLTADIIDSLKEVETSAQITPLETKLSTLSETEERVGNLKIMLASFKNIFNEMQDSDVFNKKTVKYDEDNLDIKISDSSSISPQNINIETIQLAQHDRYKTNLYDSKDTVVTTTDETLKLTINDKTFSINVSRNTTIEELADLINEQAGTEVYATLLKTSEDGDYTISLSSNNSGKGNSIEIDQGGLNLGLDLEENHVNTAQNRIFKINNIQMERDSNTLTDIIEGMEITLLTEDSYNEINVENDLDTITSAASSLADSYNSIINELSIMTNYDADTGEAGPLANNSEVNTIKSILRRDLSSMIGGTSLYNMGFDMNRYGILEFDSEEFQIQLETNYDTVNNFFVGTKNDEDTNFVEKMIDRLESIITTDSSLLGSYENSLAVKEKQIQKTMEKLQKNITSKYDTMTTRFASYDSLITSITNSWNVVQRQIDRDSDN